MLKKNSIEIISPSRLHFGFLEISGNNDRSYGGIGLSIDKFSTKIIVKKSNKVKIRINCLDKASFFLNEFCRKKKIKNNYLINIKKSSPKHIGLGSGTQLALSIGCAVSKLNNLDLDIKNISKILNRSLRSNIGLMNFKTGGFLIDLDIKKKFFTPIGKVFFPEEWKIILIKNLEKGLHGNKEVNAFRKIKKFPRKKNISLTNLNI